VVEKPFTPTSHEANELIALAKTHQRLLTVYQSPSLPPSLPPPPKTKPPPQLTNPTSPPPDRRYDSDFQTLLALLRSSALGRITEFETHFDRHRPTLPANGGGWKTKAAPGAGAVYDLGVHLIDQVVVALGMPGRVTGFLGRQREGEEGGSEDSCTVLMHYEGMMATVKAAVVSCEERQLRFWVRGVEGSYKKVGLYSSSKLVRRMRDSAWTDWRLLDFTTPILDLLPLPVFYPFCHTSTNLNPLQYHLDPQEDHLKAGRKPGDAGFGIEPPERHGALPFFFSLLPFSLPFISPHPPITSHLPFPPLPSSPPLPLFQLPPMHAPPCPPPTIFPPALFPSSSPSSIPILMTHRQPHHPPLLLRPPHLNPPPHHLPTSHLRRFLRSTREGFSP